VAEINAKTEALSEASRTLADAVYAQASAQAQSQAAGAQASGGDGAASSEDEVIEEADYEVVDEEEAKTS
jgi:hypothetical protein